MDVTPEPPTRRERLRNATIAEIKNLARQMLVAGGPQAISLRAIARDMGMTAPAIYRYFPSLDALIFALADDLYNELRETVDAARVPSDEPAQQLMEMVRAFRRWCVAHPAEFGLIFGNPVPGVVSFEDDCLGPEHAAARFGAVFLEVFATFWQQRQLPTPPADILEARLGPYLEPYHRHHETQLPVTAIYAYLSGWTRLYGLVALEVFGHLQWAVTDVEPLFELELLALVHAGAPS